MKPEREARLGSRQYFSALESVNRKQKNVDLVVVNEVDDLNEYRRHAESVCEELELPKVFAFYRHASMLFRAFSEQSGLDRDGDAQALPFSNKVCPKVIHDGNLEVLHNQHIGGQALAEVSE